MPVTDIRTDKKMKLEQYSASEESAIFRLALGCTSLPILQFLAARALYERLGQTE